MGYFDDDESDRSTPGKVRSTFFPGIDAVPGNKPPGLHIDYS